MGNSRRVRADMKVLTTTSDQLKNHEKREETESHQVYGEGECLTGRVTNYKVERGYVLKLAARQAMVSRSMGCEAMAKLAPGDA